MARSLDDRGGSAADVAASPEPALRYLDQPSSPDSPIVGGRWPAPTGASPLFQPAQAEEDENGRGGLFGDLTDLPRAYRQALYEGLRARLREIEPGNPALQTITPPGHSSSQEEIDELNAALLDAQERAGEPPSTVWSRGWGERGIKLELERLGGQRKLPFTTPTIDDFSEDGVAVSIKSIDLNASWYRDPQNLSRRIDRYVDQLWAFNSMNWGRVRIRPNEIQGRWLDIVLPKNSGTPAQREVLARSTERARRLNIHVFISYY